MKKKLVLGLVTTMTMFSLTACGSSAVVKTDSGSVSQEELYNAMKKRYAKQTLPQMTFTKILEDKYKIDQKEIDAKYNEVAKQYGDQFDAALSQSGFTKDSFKENLKYSLLVDKATKEDIKTDDKTLKNYYKTWKPEVEVRHILVKDEKTAKEVEEKLKKGEKFEDLAKKYSTDKQNKDKGGLLPPFVEGKGNMDSTFEKAAYALKKKDEVSKPVKTQFGYHIIKAVKPAEKTTFEKDKDKVKKAYVESQLTQENKEKTLKKLYKKANIKIEDKDLKDAFSGYQSDSKKDSK